MAFTRQMFLTMTWEQVKEYWRKEQEQKRAAGLPYYTVLVDPRTGKVEERVQ